MVTRKIISLSLILIGISLLFSGCEVDYYQPSKEDTQGTGSSLFGDGITVPNGFNWATIRTENLTVKVDDRFNGKYYYQVEVFDANPIIYQDAQLLAKGVAKQGQDWLTAVNFSSDLETIYVRQTSPTGQGVVKVATISGENLSVDFTPSVPAQMRSASSYASQASSAISTRSGEEGPTTVYETPKPNGTSVLELSGEKDVTFASNAPTYVIPAGETFKGRLAFSWRNSFIYVEGTWENTWSDLALNGWTVIVQNGGKVISNVEGTLKLNPNNDKGGQLIVAAGGEFGKEGKLMKLSQGDNNSKIINSGTIRTSGLSSIRYLYNYSDIYLEGVMTADDSKSSIVNKGNFIINNGLGEARKLVLQGNFQNDGVVEISGILDSQNSLSLTNSKTASFEVHTFNNPKTIKNEGVVKISGILNTNSDSFSLNNTGFFEVHTFGTSTIPAKGTITNNGQFTITNNAVLGLKFNIGPGALLEANNLTMSKSTITLTHNAMLDVTGKLTVLNAGTSLIEGPTSGNALARINEVSVEQWSEFSLGGELDVECSNYQDLPVPDDKKDNMKTGKDVSFVEVSLKEIPRSEYNKGGNNNVVLGTPKDPVFPIIFDGSPITYLFEDNWPYLGDYDMNDLVLDVIPTYSLNSSNKVTELQLDVTLRAVGATKRLAVGIQLDGIKSSDVQSFSRSNSLGINSGVFAKSDELEGGQEYAVIPVFDDAHWALRRSSAIMINTISGSPNTESPVSVTFTIKFNTPLEQASITVDKFNVFIVNGGYKTKRSEVHMTGFQPTDKADKGRFGFADSDSNENPYKSEKNMIWGLAIPGSAKYPTEWTSIRVAYPDFEKWATTGGEENKDWYKEPNNSKVYSE